MERDRIEQVTEELERAMEELSASNQRIKEEKMEVDKKMVKEEVLQEAPQEILQEAPQEIQKEEKAIVLKADKLPHKKYVRKETTVSSKGLFRPSDGLMAAFFVPIVVMIIVFAQRGIFPFGENSFLRTDMYHQYAPFFSEFQDKIKDGGSLLYSWNIGMGVNFAALYAYYLASPLNWLLLLVPKGFIIEFMTYSIVFKIGLSGLTMAYYLRKHNRTHDFGIAFFGIFYALSGYVAAYSWNIMWLDCILLFPLIVLGLERLVKEKKCFLYCITLGLSILSNYYISIMICIFMVIYFVALLVLEAKKSWKQYAVNCFQFAVFSLLAGGLAAAVLLPEIYALQATASSDFTFPKTFETYFSIFDMLARHIGNVQTEIGLDHWPNIYCGVAVYIFFLLYLVSRKITVKEKAVYCVMLLFFFASFSTNVLNFMWHGFHYPNSLPSRQSFIYIFLILFVCYRAYMYLKETSMKTVGIAFLGSVCFVLMAEKLVTEDHYYFVVFYVAILFLSLYAGLIYLYKNKKAGYGMIMILALGLVSLETAVNTVVTSVTTTSRTAYLKDNRSTIALTKGLENAGEFYRVHKDDQKTKNDGAWMNYPSISLFSSTADASLTKFFKQLGCESSTNSYSINGSTPLVESLISAKYTLYPKQQPMNERQTLVDEKGDMYLYENAYTMPLGFMLPEDLEYQWQQDLPNPADVQNDLSSILNLPNVLEDQDIFNQGNQMTFEIEREGDYYVYILNKKVEEVTYTLGDTKKTFGNVNRGYFLKLGRLKSGDQVSLEAKGSSEDLNAKVYRFSHEAMVSVYERLNESPLNMTQWEDDKLTGTVKVEKDGVLFTSIPYDKGWTLLVDGVKTTPKELFDTFLAVELSAGDHTIEFSYMPQGLPTGMIITSSCLGVLLLLWLFGIWMNKRKNR